MDTVIVVGAGGHAKVIIDIIEKAKVFEIAFLVDDEPSLKSTKIHGYSVLGDRDSLLAQGDAATVHRAIVAIGDNIMRTHMAQWLREHRFELATAIHPSSQIARGVTIGENTVVMAGTVINSDATIGESVIINTAASVDHDCIIADGVHVAPGSRLCGSVSVGARTLVGAGTTVVRSATIGSDTIVGAGSVVVADIPPNVIAVGNPAKSIRSNLQLSR